MLNEQQLIYLIGQGDEAAFRQLVQQYQPMIFSIAVAVVKDDFLAEEIVQDVFMKAYTQIHTFKHRSSFRTWLYRIATNESLMQLRRANKAQIAFTGDVPEQLQEPDMSGMDPALLQLLVHRSLRMLPHKESLALRLFYLEDMNIQAVSDITGWLPGNVKVILHRARKQMAVVMQDVINKETDHG